MPWLDDPVLKFLWLKVQKLGSYENSAVSYWHHLYTKKIFKDENYVVDYEQPPIAEEQNMRRVDQTVSVLDQNWGMLLCLIFHEIKRMECTPDELENLETQAFTACESYCKKHNIGQVYAQTSIGSRARFFHYKPGAWTPLDGKNLGDYAAYRESGDQEGEDYIRACLRKIKNDGPWTPTITWIWDATRQEYFYATPLFYIYRGGAKYLR